MDEASALLPVILTLESGNFHDMSHKEIRKLYCEVIHKTGGLSDLPPMRLNGRGDMFIDVTDRNEQQRILRLTEVAGRKVRCRLPLSRCKGVVHNIAVVNTAEQILRLLSDQAVDVRRIYRNGEPTSSLIVTFKSNVPPEVVFCGMKFRVYLYHPPPKRCRRCWRLGHEQSICRLKLPDGWIKCRRCSRSHPDNGSCSDHIRCINCSSPSHEADDNNCPVYRQWKEAIAFSIRNNVSIPQAQRMVRKETLEVATPPAQQVAEQARLRPDATVHSGRDFGNWLKQLNRMTEKLDGIASTVGKLLSEKSNTYKGKPLQDSPKSVGNAPNQSKSSTPSGAVMKSRIPVRVK